MSILNAIAARTTEQIGDLIESRCYPYQMPRDTSYPAVMFFRVSDIDDYPTHDGDYSLIQSRFQFNTYAKSVGELDELTGRFLRAWLGYKGTVANVSIKNVQKLGRGNPSRSEFKVENLNIFYEIVDLSMMYDRSY